MADEPKLTTDEYDAKHGKPEATPDAPAISVDDQWGGKLNPVRDTALAGANLKTVT